MTTSKVDEFTRDGAEPRQKIVPHLWFDSQAEEAAEFYASLFPESRIGTITRYSSAGKEIHGQPEGSVMTVELELAGYRLIGLNGGPHFRFTPSISFFVTLDSAAAVDELWNALSEGGTPLMELDRYPWSERYGWVQDRFGLSWQIQSGDVESVGQRIVPFFMYVGEEPKAKAAMELYTETFENARIDRVSYRDEQQQVVEHATFRLDGEVFMAMDGGAGHAFDFTEAISLLVQCQGQDEIDRFWERLSQDGDPRAQQCGWLKDRFGVSWQVSPVRLHEMLEDSDPERVRRVTNAFMQMKKLNLAELEAAYAGEHA